VLIVGAETRTDFHPRWLPAAWQKELIERTGSDPWNFWMVGRRYSILIFAFFDAVFC